MPYVTASLHLTGKTIEVAFKESNGTTWLYFRAKGESITQFTIFMSRDQLERIVADLQQQLHPPIPNDMPDDQEAHYNERAEARP